MNEDKLALLKKYPHVFEGPALERLQKNPIIFSKRKFRVELERLYNEHTRRLLRKKAKETSLARTLGGAQLVHGNQSRAVAFGARMVYSAEKYSAHLPEAEAFLGFLHPGGRRRLLFYLLLRLVYKTRLRVGFLDHLRGTEAFDSFSAARAKAKRVLEEACQKDALLQRRLVSHLDARFAGEGRVPYYGFLTEMTAEGAEAASFNVLRELVQVHLGSREVFAKRRFEAAKHDSENPFAAEPKAGAEAPFAEGLEKDFKSTQKLHRRSTSRGPRHTSRRAQQRSLSQAKSRPRLSSRKSARAQETLKLEQRRFSPKPERPPLKTQPRQSLVARVEGILGEGVRGDEQKALLRIEEEIRAKAEKVLNKFVERFRVSQPQIDRYGLNLGYTVIAKAKLAVAFVATREADRFFALMQSALDRPQAAQRKRFRPLWESLVRRYAEALEAPEAAEAVRALVVELFGLPAFQSEIVFLLKYFFKVS